MTIENQIIPDRAAAVDLLHGLVAIPSLSGEEAEAAHWLVSQMRRLGFDRAFVDGAGNAVGEMGSSGARCTVVLLGHIDTVAGQIAVRVEEGMRLYGRGSVDAKGPLATFVAAVARLGSAWAYAHDLRVVVVGAVEEEAATSKGARFIAARFDGVNEPIPAACIIGEPSSWQRMTLGYKGRLLVDIEAAQPMAHTAGPEHGVAIVAVDFWNWLAAYAADFNRDRDKTFDQLQPSLRGLRTWTDDAMQDRIWARAGIRLPLDFAVAPFVAALIDWAKGCANADTAPAIPSSIEPGERYTLPVRGAQISMDLHFLGYEPAWRSDRNNALVRAFLAGIRSQSEERPGFVVKTGTSDMNVVGPAWGCPIVAYGPGDSALDHTPDEHIPLDDYWQAVLVLEQTLRHLGSSLRD
ncbi:MAG: M20/M25/M40 family metallo-hydrolase [Caldilineaceae bacterium]|nr:M20/M25/M40 family metallo-hydrolase [Caldilineaceae bacterium]